MKCEVVRDCVIRGTTWARGRLTWAGASVIWAASTSAWAGSHSTWLGGGTVPAPPISFQGGKC